MECNDFITEEILSIWNTSGDFNFPFSVVFDKSVNGPGVSVNPLLYSRVNRLEIMFCGREVVVTYLSDLEPVKA